MACLLQGKICPFVVCQEPPKFRNYGILSKGAVQYSKLLIQKREFQEFIRMNEVQISSHEKMNSCSIVDRNHSLKGSSVDIFIFDGIKHQNSLYLDYSTNKQFMIRNCNDLITFLNLRKSSTFHLHQSSVYIRSASGFKWESFYDLFEFLIKKSNKCIIGSQFYFPMACKFLIMNEIRLLCLLHNWHKGLETNKSFMKNPNQSLAWEATVLDSLEKEFPTEELPLSSGMYSVKCKSWFLQDVNKAFVGNLDSPRASKRKSLDSGNNKCKITKFSPGHLKNSLCHCSSKSKIQWIIFRPFKEKPILSYTNILRAERDLSNSEITHIFPAESRSYGDQLHYFDSDQFSQSSLNTSSKILTNTESAHKVFDVVNTTRMCLVESAKIPPKFKQTSNLCTLDKIMPTLSDEENVVNIDNTENFQSSSNKECFNRTELSYLKGNVANKSKETAAGSSTGTLPKTTKCFVSFQTAAGKSLNVSAAAIKSAEKMFEEVCAEEADVFVGGKSENLPPSNQGSKAYDLRGKNYSDDDINNIFAENFFEDIPFDEKEINSKPSNSSVESSLMQLSVAQTGKVRKSLGGRRSLKPYTVKKY